MNIKDAKDKVLNGITAKELKDVLAKVSGDMHKPSKLNNGLTRAQAYEIFDQMLKQAEDDYVFKPRLDLYRRQYNWGHALGAVNILREFG